MLPCTKRSVNVRKVLNGGVLCPMDPMPMEGVAKGPATKSTVHDDLARWNWDDTWERNYHAPSIAVPRRKDVNRARWWRFPKRKKGAQDGDLATIRQAAT